MISQLEQKQQIIYLYCQPVRESIVKFTSQSGAGRDDIFREMSQRASEVVHTQNQNPVRDNQKCFECFEKDFFPKSKSTRTAC